METNFTPFAGYSMARLRRALGSACLETTRREIRAEMERRGMVSRIIRVKVRKVVVR